MEGKGIGKAFRVIAVELRLSDRQGKFVFFFVSSAGLLDVIQTDSWWHPCGGFEYRRIRVCRLGLPAWPLFAPSRSERQGVAMYRSLFLCPRDAVPEEFCLYI